MSRKVRLSYETENDVFARHLREAMDRKGVNQTWLANTIGVQRQTISLYVTGQSRPDTDNLRKISEALNISSDWLLGLSNFTDKSNEFVLAKDLGLTEPSISLLTKCIQENNPDVLDGINSLLSDVIFYFFGW